MKKNPKTTTNPMAKIFQTLWEQLQQTDLSPTTDIHITSGLKITVVLHLKEIESPNTAVTYL
uniref:Uncharacterized protein n=1 Tax=Anguilla anguilla TaxID=7936 RepID=A0A0E9WU34_ANGAN